MMLEHGDFSEAEGVLRTATAFLQGQLASSPRQSSQDRKHELSNGSGSGNSPVSPSGHSPVPSSSQTAGQSALKLDSRYFRLQLKLAKLMLDSYHCERGVKLLEEQLTVPVPHNKRKSVYAVLAAGHNKLWQTAECDVCLAKAQSAVTDASALAGHDAFALAITGVRNLLKAGRPAEALRRLDVALRDERRLSALGQLLLLRGRVLQALAALAVGNGGSLPSGYGCVLDVVQASSESLTAARELFCQVQFLSVLCLILAPRVIVWATGRRQNAGGEGRAAVRADAAGRGLEHVCPVQAAVGGLAGKDRPQVLAAPLLFYSARLLSAKGDCACVPSAGRSGEGSESRSV